MRIHSHILNVSIRIFKNFSEHNITHVSYDQRLRDSKTWYEFEDQNRIFHWNFAL